MEKGKGRKFFFFFFKKKKTREREEEDIKIYMSNCVVEDGKYFGF